MFDEQHDAEKLDIPAEFIAFVVIGEDAVQDLTQGSVELRSAGDEANVQEISQGGCHLAV